MAEENGNVLPLRPDAGEDQEPAPEQPKRGRVTQAELLVRQVREVAEDGPELFHTPDQVPYVTFTVGGHRETHPLKSRPFRIPQFRSFRSGVPPVPATTLL